MKGPYERLKYNLQRVWECPKCHQRQRTDGTVTGLQCQCQFILPEDQRVSMALLQDDIRRSQLKQPTATAAKPAKPATPEVEAQAPDADSATNPPQTDKGQPETS